MRNCWNLILGLNLLLLQCAQEEAAAPNRPADAFSMEDSSVEYPDEVDSDDAAVEEAGSGSGSVANVDQGSSNCPLLQNIETLELRVRGNILEPKLIAEGVQETIPSQGLPSRFDFSFNDQAHFVHEQSKVNIFSTRGRVTTMALARYKLAELQYLQIEKKGFQMENKRQCEKHRASEDICDFTISEHKRFELYDLEIIVNGTIPIYRRTNLDIAFERGDLLWIDSNLQGNPMWLQLTNHPACLSASNGNQNANQEQQTINNINNINNTNLQNQSL